MIQREKIEELLSLPVDERRRVVQLLQESLSEVDEGPSSLTGEPISPAAKWLLSMAGRYSGGPGNTASRADQIMRDEVDKHRGLTTN